MTEHHDVVIVGGGHNGLTAAAYLASAGRSVLLLERSSVLGGAAISAPAFPGLDARLSRYSYLVSLLPQRIVHDLGLDIRLVRRRYSSYTPRPGTDTGLLVDTLDPTSLGSEALAWTRFYDRTSRLAQALFPTVTEPLLRRSEARALVADDTAWATLVDEPIGATIEREFADDLVRGVALTDALIGTFAPNVDPTLAGNRCFLYHVIGGGTGDWDVPVGGMGAVTGELARAARRAGARLETDAEVTAITPDGDVTVRLRGAERTVHGDVVLANVAPAVLASLVTHPPTEYQPHPLVEEPAHPPVEEPALPPVEEPASAASRRPETTTAPSSTEWSRDASSPRSGTPRPAETADEHPFPPVEEPASAASRRPETTTAPSSTEWSRDASSPRSGTPRPAETAGPREHSALGAQVKVNLLLSRLPALRDASVDPAQAFGGTFHVNETWSQLQSAYDAASAGTVPEPLPLEIYCHSLSDPSILGPELRASGAQTITVFGLHVPDALQGGADAASVLQRAALDSLDAVLGEPIEPLLLTDADGRPAIETKTTRDLERALAMPGGNIFHGPLAWPFAEDDAELATPAQQWGVATAWPRILLCGSGAQRGGAVSGIGGHNAAMAVLQAG
ncbi:FAD-dependent oxidoreductase [Galbitalea sp. SE-J8]|uniref:phytoene desaturase family protein n=1 Tax=Galbitalea sp. SE-J8 TaxID=3054952 RepID=UPI00259C8DD9|nr:FAD-dependent oxidoreductase [Galbitalea sp. SE-J8]MDM4763337.1 FAD-dependent oxidoreductase [Galbitalea sp. SE-J8]